MPLHAVTGFMARPRFFSARVAEKACVVMIPQAAFTGWVLDHPQVAQGILNTMGDLLVLFCMSGTGIYGSMSEGMTGDSTLLIVKAILDLFTAPIFASTMGFTVGILVIPQFAVQSALYCAASLILPLLQPDMLADFSACGGLVMVATGFRICGIKPFPVASMIPSLFLVMPLSWLWAVYLG